MPNQSQGWFAKTFPTPSTPQEAANALDSTGKGFYWLGMITVGLGLFLGATMVFDGFTYVVLGWALKRYRSRGVAVILAAISVVGIAMTARNQFAGGSGGRNVVLALIVTAWALHACKVTFIYHRLIGSRVNTVNVVIKSLLATVYAVLAFIVAIIVGVVLGVDIENMSDAAGTAFAAVVGLAIGAAFAGVLPFTRGRLVTSVTEIQPT